MKNLRTEAIDLTSGSRQNPIDNGREGDPFTFANFTLEGAPYDLMANIFRDLED